MFFPCIYPFLFIVVQLKPCPVQLSLKIAEKDKAAMVHAIQTRGKADGRESDLAQIPKIQATDLPLDSALDGPEWYTFEKPLLFVYGGQGPYVGRCVYSFWLSKGVLDCHRDFMAFPVSLPDDGLVDVVAQELVRFCQHVLVSLLICDTLDNPV
jgi:sphingosine kinase